MELEGREDPPSPRSSHASQGEVLRLWPQGSLESAVGPQLTATLGEALGQRPALTSGRCHEEAKRSRTVGVRGSRQGLRRNPFLLPHQHPPHPSPSHRSGAGLRPGELWASVPSITEQLGFGWMWALSDTFTFEVKV